MRKKKVLVIAYLFPPIGGIGVQRPLKMVKYLRDYGWQPYVLTVEPRYHATFDRSLLQEIPQDVPVFRVPQTDLTVLLDRKRGLSGGALSDTSSGAAAGANQPGAAAGTTSAAVAGSVSRAKAAAKQIYKTLKNLLFIPDDQVFWYLRARKTALQIVKNHEIDAVYATSGPHSDLLLGRYVKEKTGITFIAEFRDPWTQNMHFSATGWRKALEERLEARVMRDADAVVTVTQAFARNFSRKYPGIKRLEVIYNGFDPDDYRHIRPAGTNGGKFTLVYTGILYAKRHPRLFLQAVYELLQEGRIPREELLISFAGVFDYPGYSENHDFVRAKGLTDVVRILGYLPHQEALAHLKGADVQLLIGDIAPQSGDYIPGKLFEYMALGRPILALSVPGETTEIIDRYGLGRWVHPQDTAAMKEALYSLYVAWKKGELPAGESSSNPRLALYRRDRQAGQLAELLGNLL